MKKKLTFALITFSISMSGNSQFAFGDQLGKTVDESKSALIESIAVEVKASQIVNEAEEKKLVAPRTKAESELASLVLDEKAAEYKKKAEASLDKALEYFLEAKASSGVDKENFTTAAENYENTSHILFVASDLILAAQQKVLSEGAKFSKDSSSADKVENINLRSTSDAAQAIVEAKIELKNQANSQISLAEASKVSINESTQRGVADAKVAISELSINLNQKKDVLLEIAAGYTAKANASTGELKKAYEEAANIYIKAAAAAKVASAESEKIIKKFTNAIPENPVNPGENLKWHIFQPTPDVALAVMKYNFAQLSMSSIRWQNQLQTVMQNPAPYLDASVKSQPILEYIDGFRTSSLSVSSEAADLSKLLLKYNDQILIASDSDAQKWKQVSSYLSDIIISYQETAEAQYQIYAFLSKEIGMAPQSVNLIVKSPEVVQILKEGDLKVKLEGEIESTISSGKTTVEAFTSQPGKVVTLVLEKKGSKTITQKATADDNGAVSFNVAKPLDGFTATIKADGKVLDAEKVQK